MNKNPIYRFDDFNNGEILHNKKKNYLPAMGWNSWNAFGSGNTEELTKAMADKMVELKLDELGYKYIVLDDGCYKASRVDGLLSNEEFKFPSGFKALADYIHKKGLKFGMYNDIGTNLCAGANVGTCGHEMEDAKTYLEWDVDFLKVDNCYYLWDNATFSDPENARYVFAPNIKKVIISKNNSQKQNADILLNAAKDGEFFGERIETKGDYVTFIGTFDGTGPDRTPVGNQSGELRFTINIEEAGTYDLSLLYATGRCEGMGSFLQIAVEHEGKSCLLYDDFVEETPSASEFKLSKICSISLSKGKNILRLMNHRRQENTLASYGTLVQALKHHNPEKDIVLSICEWGKTSPQNWGYKIGDSWRILNDITFQVGADGDPGNAAWESDYTTSVTAQYNKAVIMDEFAGLNKGWNDPDMMMIGMNGLDDIQCRTHMTMWCMMNSPLMLGLDLRRVNIGDSLWNIISNKKLIDINQDSLGIQAKRVFSTLQVEKPDSEYIRDNNRVDILAKPLSDGSLAVSIINLSNNNKFKDISISLDEIINMLGHKMINKEAFLNAEQFLYMNLWTGEECVATDKIIVSGEIVECDNLTLRIKAL